MHEPRFRLTPEKPRISENDVEERCLALLARRGYWSGRNHCGKFQTPDGRWLTGAPKGTPDYAMIHAHFPGFLLEVKAPGEDANEVQKTRIMEIRLGFHLGIAVIDSVEAMNRWIEQHEGRT